MYVPEVLVLLNSVFISFHGKTRFAVGWGRIVNIPFDGSASAGSAMPSSALVELHGCMENWIRKITWISFFFFSASLFLSLKLCNYSIT